MSNKKEINSAKILIQKVFEMWFRIPEYQRPYVWGDDQINDLLEDLSYAAKYNPESDYFLGSFVFQHKPASIAENRLYEENDLLDGQQRLTTLFLLMAVARDLTNVPALKELCQDCIYQKANQFKKIPEIIRIHFKIRPEVENFVDEFVKVENATLRIEDLTALGNDNSIDISIRNMARAIIKISTFFKSPTHVSLETFFEFLLNKVLMVYVSSEDLEDAFRLFTILNDRGVKLRNSDILKAQNLRALKTQAEQQKWAKFWEELESELQEDFDRFMSWIRTILVKEKARLNLLKEFEDNIYNPKEKDKSTGLPKPILLNKGLDTFKLIENYYKHYGVLFGRNNYNFTNSWAFDNLLTIMETGLPATDWIPPLLAYYNKFKEKEIFTFLKKLNNKFSADWIGQYTPTERIENMNDIIKQIEHCNTPQDLFNTKVFEVDADSLFRSIEGNVYGRQYARYILLKLDYIFHDNHAHKLTGFEQISVEHILPQNPDKSSQWQIDFDEADREQLTNKIGNLILLGRRKNSSQGNLDYEIKKDKYFKSSINIFPNSIRVMNAKKWTKKEINDNQDFVVNKLKEYYSF